MRVTAEGGAPTPTELLHRDAVLGAVFRSDYGALVGLARLLDRVDAEEVVQEAFVRTYVAWDGLRNQDDPRPYLRQTVVNLARGRWRRQATARRYDPPRLAVAAAAEDEAVTREDQRVLRSVIRSLPRRQRECVVLRYFLECSTEETAAALGVSVGSVKTHLHRALSTIEASMEDTR